MASLARFVALGSICIISNSSQGKRLVSASSSTSDRLSSLIFSRDAPFGGSRVSPRILAAVSFDTSPGARATVSVPEVLEQLQENMHLTRQQSEAVMNTFLDQENLAQISAFLALLRQKGETTDEILGMGKAVLKRCLPVEGVTGALDIVGTGDGSNTVNISTGSAILAAACGAKVAKSGSRSFSSACGGADVLESFGVAVNLGPEGVANCVNELGIGFMLASRYHPANCTVAYVGKAMKTKTALNFLGPILNPARVPYAIIGVHCKKLMMKMAVILQEFGVERALVVHSDGLDEMSPIGGGSVLDVTKNKIRPFKFDPLEFGILPCTVSDLKGGNSTLNAKILWNVLAGEEGHIANALILNAGAGLMVCGVTKNFQDGVALAREVQQSGKAIDLLNAWIALSRKMYDREMEDIMKEHEWEMGTTLLS